jgi:hypothetical protein
MDYSGAGGKLIHEKNKKQKILWHCPFKDTKPYMSAFLSVDLLTEFVAFCLTDFIDWRSIHSWCVFSTQLVNCCPHGWRNYMLLVHCCPSTVPSLWPPPPFPVYSINGQCVTVGGGGGAGGCWNVLWTIFCRSFTLFFWPDSELAKLLHHTKQKWPVKTTLRDWCLYSSFGHGTQAKL